MRLNSIHQITFPLERFAGKVTESHIHQYVEDNLSQILSCFTVLYMYRVCSLVVPLIPSAPYNGFEGTMADSAERLQTQIRSDPHTVNYV